MVKNGAKNVKEKYGSNSTKNTFKTQKASDEQIRQIQFDNQIKQKNQNETYQIEKDEKDEPNVENALYQNDQIAKLCENANSNSILTQKTDDF